jgi:hypothetical protein
MIIQKSQLWVEELTAHKEAKYFSFSTAYRSASVEAWKLPSGNTWPVWSLLSVSTTR